MKKIVSFFAVLTCLAPAVAATPAGQSRRSMASQMVMAAPRATASTNQISAMASVSTSDPMPSKSSVRVEEVDTTTTQKVDNREKERAACINNNIGIGNTFVWASRYSNTNNYASMVEDTENPDNNTCFVKVELKSSDAKISVSDVPSQYYEMGRNITCGAWADEAKLKDRILAAKKSARTWGTVGGAVGGAGIGVGIMELFGNRLIGGKVMGQKDLEGTELLRSQLLVVKNEHPSEFKEFTNNLRTLKKECENKIWDSAPDKKPDACSNIDYDYLLNLES